MRYRSSYYFSILVLGFFLFGSSSFLVAQTEDKYKVLTVPNVFSKSKFYPFGGYLLFGEKPPQFKDFYSFSLENTKPNLSGKELEIVGAVMTIDDKNSNTYRMEEVLLTDKMLTFKTEKIAEVHYEFKGQYTRKGDLRRFYKAQTPVLKGLFTKFSADKPLASTAVTFYFKVWKAEPYYQPEK